MNIFKTICFFPEDGTGAGAGAGLNGSPSAGAGSPSSGGAFGAALDAAKKASQETGGVESQGDGEGVGYWPDGLPDHLKQLRGSSDRETIERLAAEAAKAPRAPAKPDDYAFEPSSEFKEKYGDLVNDKAMKIWREACHKAGLSNDQFNGAVTGLYEMLSKEGVLEDPFDPQKFLEDLGGDKGAPEERRRAGAARITAIDAFMTGLVKRQVITADEGKHALSALAATKEGVVVLEKLARAMGESGLKGGGVSVPALSKDSVVAKMRDPRYDTQSPKYENSFREQVDREWRELHGAR